MATTTRKRKAKKPADVKRYVNVGLDPSSHDILTAAAQAEDRTLTAQAARWLRQAAVDWDGANQSVPLLANTTVSDEPDDSSVGLGGLAEG